MSRAWPTLVLVILLVGACSDTEPEAGGGAREETPTAETPTTTTPLLEAPPETTPEEPETVVGKPDEEASPEWEGTITVGGVVYELVVEWCDLDDDLELSIGGSIAGRADSGFEIDRVDDPVFGVEDLVWVLIGSPNAPAVYWEASVISQGERGSAAVFLKVDGRRVTAQAWFEDRSQPTSGESVIDGDIVAGIIDVSC